VRVELVRSHRALHDRLLQDAAAPTFYQWVGQDDDPDLVIFLVPPWPDPGAPRRLARLRPKDYRRLFVFSQADTAVPWAPGVYASLPLRDAGSMFAGGFYVPVHHFEPGGAGDMLDQVADEPDLLWSFFGSVRTCPSVRGRVVALRDERSLVHDTETWGRVRWMGERDPIRNAAIAEYVRSLARVKFVIAPRGVGPSTIRLFEAMRAGRAPVIVSDDWLPPPLIDWEQCSIQVSEADIGRLPAILRERESEAKQLGQRARAVWEAHFSPATMVHHLVASCLLIHERRPTTRQRLRLSAAVWGRREALRQVRAICGAELSRLWRPRSPVT
jgi:hypothetical protein